jgi:hypothetical protein
MTGEYAAAGVTPGRSVRARVDGRSGSGYRALAAVSANRTSLVTAMTPRVPRGDVLAAGVPEAFRGEFKWLGDVTTPIRDLDVYLLGYGDMAGRLLSATPAELAPLHDHLAQRLEMEQRELARALRSRRFLAMTKAWRDAFTGPTPRATRLPGHPTPTRPKRVCAAIPGSSARSRYA